MNTTKITILLLIGTIFVACNEKVADTPEEDYLSLFGKKEIPTPTYDNIIMPKLSCDPRVSQATYIYPGKEVASKTTYKVTLNFWFSETKAPSNQSIQTTQSEIQLRYVNENRELEILTTFEDKDLQNGTTFTKEFEVESGFPLYLGIYGSSFDYFEMKASIQAESLDGLILTPEILYEQKLYSDGHSDEFNFCEKIILP